METVQLSRSMSHSSKWKLQPINSKKICKDFWIPDMDLFASRVSHQVSAYIAWKPDPNIKGIDAFQQLWWNLKGLCFLIGQVLCKY